MRGPTAGEATIVWNARASSTQRWRPPAGYADTYPGIQAEVWTSQVDQVIEAFKQISAG